MFGDTCTCKFDSRSLRQLTVEQMTAVRIPSVSTPREDRKVQTVSDVGVQAKCPAPDDQPPRHKRLQYLEMRAREAVRYLFLIHIHTMLKCTSSSLFTFYSFIDFSSYASFSSASISITHEQGCVEE